VIGSTVVVLMSYERHFACLWAGDSRAYRLRDGAFQQISKDHSVVQHLIDSGSLSREDAKHDRRSNVITRAVGVYEEINLDLVDGVMQPNDVFLLCSDGLSGPLEDEEIAQHLKGNVELAAAADSLIDAALDRGGRDNITLVLIRVNANPDDTQNQDTTLTSAWPTG
jgi:protein phosphatase